MINKKWLMFGMILLVLPMVLAVSTQDPRPVLDLFYLFVELTFGNMILAGFGIAGMLFFICMIGRMSLVSILFIVTSFLFVYGTGLVGAIVAVPITIGAVFYFAKSAGLI